MVTCRALRAESLHQGHGETEAGRESVRVPRSLKSPSFSGTLAPAGLGARMGGSVRAQASIPTPREASLVPSQPPRLPAPQTWPRAKHRTSPNPNYVRCHSTVVRGGGGGGGAWSHTQERGQKAGWLRAPDQAWPLPTVVPAPPASPSTMSGRVGDLSPKQAETLAKVRVPCPAAPERRRAGGQRGGGGSTLPYSVGSGCP